MTAPSAYDHVIALRDHLVAQLGAEIPVGIGVAPVDQAPPYLALYPDPGDASFSTLGGERNNITLHVMVHAVGAGSEQAIWAGDKARAALLDHPLTVAGRHMRRISQELSPPPLNRDDAVEPPVYLQVTEYIIRSEPAAA